MGGTRPHTVQVFLDLTWYALFSSPGRVEGKGKEKLRQKRGKETVTEREWQRDGGEKQRHKDGDMQRDRDREKWESGSRRLSAPGRRQEGFRRAHSWAGTGRRQEECATRDPGCVQSRRQGHLPGRDREGMQGRFPGG